MDSTQLLVGNLFAVEQVVAFDFVFVDDIEYEFVGGGTATNGY